MPDKSPHIAEVTSGEALQPLAQTCLGSVIASREGVAPGRAGRAEAT
ncbi:MAG: hypothetical protein KAU38_17325 [Desulfobacterales bacterium]|nr:hypothetical protein [Desulfobacterales bacterium]